MTTGHNVLLPLLVAFVLYTLGTLNFAKSAGRFVPVQPVKAKPK